MALVRQQHNRDATGCLGTLAVCVEAAALAQLTHLINIHKLRPYGCGGQQALLQLFRPSDQRQQRHKPQCLQYTNEAQGPLANARPFVHKENLAPAHTYPHKTAPLSTGIDQGPQRRCSAFQALAQCASKGATWLHVFKNLLQQQFGVRPFP